MAYAAASDVATELGRTFTAGQTTQATDLIASAQALIDARCHRTFEASAQITDELHLIEGSYLYLSRSPVASVASVKVRSSAVGADLTTLTSGDGYEVLSLAEGVIRLGSTYGDSYALVTYTPAVTVPADIKRATVLIVAAWMAKSIEGGMSGVKSYQVGGELRVEYADPGALPGEALAILNRRVNAAAAFA